MLQTTYEGVISNRQKFAYSKGSATTISLTSSATTISLTSGSISQSCS